MAAVLSLLLLAAPFAATAGPAPLPAIESSDRVLVIAPHPDDETLCCAGLLLQAQARGATVAVIWVTAGDGYRLDAMLEQHTVRPGAAAMRRLGNERLQEAHRAADRLGIPRELQFELGYPDRGLAALTGEYYSRPYHSEYTDTGSVPYAGAVHPGAAYTGASLEQDLELLLGSFAPTLVLAPAAEDRHPDHNASGLLVRRLLQRRGQLASLRCWIVHAPDWPRPLGLHPERALAPPRIAAALRWRSLPLSRDERALKLTALRDYRSQMDVMRLFLEAFVRSNELFALPGGPTGPAGGG